MSGKPASVGASRAGVPGTPRVLVYVADPRQLEPGAAGPEPPPAAAVAPPPPAAALPPQDTLYIPENLHHQVNLSRNTVYRTQFDRNDQRNLPANVYYKQLNDNDGKVNVYGVPDNVTQRTEFYPVSQQYIKESCSKNEDSRSDRLGNISVKRDCSEQAGTEFNSVETFHTRVPVETVDLATYQARCSGPVGSDNTMNSMHPAALRHGQNQYSENVTVQSGVEGSNCSERELSVCKSFVNYQFLEQSVSHQSIVNQSISILNQQVGVSRGIVSEGDSGSAPQLVRTADGVVLAVLPAPVLPHAPDNAELSSRTVVQSDSQQTVTVPLGWKRIVSGTSVLYVSPSGTALSTLPQLREYLQTTGTCKCGLPCPLRPETAFSFDPKVLSKPYQAASGAELTKLCNHKRKLLTTLQARAQSPATPPPQTMEQKKVTGSEVSVLKKKTKKRAGFPTNVSVSQLMVQRERPLNEFKGQETEANRENSVMAPQRATNAQHCLPSYQPVQQNVSNAAPQDNEVKQETHVQKSSHYLTVNSGWISQHSQQLEDFEAQIAQRHNLNSPINSPLPGMPVRGANGQIIGVNTGHKQSTFLKNNPNLAQQFHEAEAAAAAKEEKKEMSIVQQNVQAKYPFKEEESQMFCGLNQALTPEVMQKINEQQQIFIQQNQKQIEMAMKGYRTQLAENINQNKSQGPGQYVSQGQLVIQNGTVMKTNPAKTPPWQVKRNEPSASNCMTSPSPKLAKSENDYEESNTSVSEDSSSSSYSSFSSNEQINQGMCSRVPPLPQHYNMMGQHWPVVDTNKKKAKGSHNKNSKKKNNPENKALTYGSNGMRMMQDSKTMNDEVQMNSVPSFMDDPSGYLAQQTVLLNNTISKQVGINSSYEANQYEGPSAANCCAPQHQMDKMNPMSKPAETSNAYRSNVPNPSQSPTSTPDSSVLSDKPGDNNMQQCCKGCNVSMKSASPDYSDSQMRLKYMKQQMYKMEMESNSTMSSPKHSFDDNPVTSSTFIERSPMVNDNCGPIQAATVSTSNVSMTETLQPPEPSPTLSSSSRSTDTPHSNGSNSSQMQSNCSYPMPSPAYSNSGSCRDNFSNPSTPGSNQVYPYNSPGPPNNTQSMTGTQVMHFISNHNVNKNLMEVDNISMVGVKPGLKPSQELYRLEPRRRIENTMPGYCPPPHLGGGPAHTLIQACYVQTFVTTMASGFSVTRDTVTSVLAGKANTATTSINASQANFIRPPPPPSVNLATTYAIPNNQPDPFINSVNLPTSYPLHIAGTTAQNMISKSPLEMVQNVIGSLPSKLETSGTHTMSLNRRATTPGQILISSTGQIMVSNNQMPPPPPKTSTAMSSMQSNMTNVSTSVTQVMPAVGGMQPMVNQPTVVVNAMPAPFVIQPPMMAVDGQVMQQNNVMPQIVAGGLVPGQSSNDNPRQIDMKNQHSFVQGVAMLSPESLKKRSKKKKNQSNITNVLQITAPQQNPNNIMVHHTSPQHNTSPQFSPRGFQLSPNNNISPTPMLQALTIVPGKSGTPAHIVMNGQGNNNNFGSQQIITNTSPSQQINLLQPVNLINNASGVVPNFPAFQQFIVPNLGGMMMTADGTAIIPDNSSGMPVQLQLQTVNGQNVLTPVQNPGVFAASTNGGVVLRAQNQQSKIIQSQHSPGAQFLSPNSQVMMNSPNFNGQLSPLLANLSPTNVTFNNPQVRSSNLQTQEFIQTNQMGQALMVPLSPKQVSLSSATSNRGNSTFVHQNTTIVQQQTTLVSNSHNTQMSSITTNLQGGNASRLSIDPNILLGNKSITNQKGRGIVESPPGNMQDEHREDKHLGGTFGRAQLEGAGGRLPAEGGGALAGSPPHVRHSVSTQTLVNQRKSPCAHAVGSPPDTTTHSPLGALEAGGSPRLYAARCLSTQANYADTTTKSPEPADASSSAMVQCVSSSEQDMAESREHAWPVTRNDFNSDTDTQSMISNTPMMRQNRSHNPVESTDMHFNQNMNTSPMNNQQVMAMTSNYYERTQTYKRKNDFGDPSTYRPDKIMRTANYNMVHGLQKDTDYESMGMSSPDKTQPRHFPLSGTSSDSSAMPKVFDRHNMGPGDDGKSSEARARTFAVGDVVWGPAKGYLSWPGKLRARLAGGRWAVRWFGALGAAALPAHRLLTLSEGLDLHHAARTKHRKSRKLNTLLENAIQEAMAELDKKSESSGERDDSTEPLVGEDDVTDAPRRSKKPRSRDRQHKKNPAKIAPAPNSTGDGARLRSSR
ncbi:hypothetical protein PYW08_001564 [Mythimna loreyi]|uniref:Uncharacterized protein n=1 Tax=Mythimna loreyi TaxID=667449 RepID=A0ACC2R4B2_9NEOP|nr:hypothetical protein PYW08_001564 [Mythimna loreyi]